MSIETIWPWIAFNLFIAAMLAVDLGIFHRKAHAVSLKEASIWSAVWITLALIFNVGLYMLWGPNPALQFFTGWLIEKSLSVDNIFVFVLLFSFFSVPAAYQHRVLFWGVIGALIMRGLLIGVGAVLLNQFHWILFVFGVFLIFTGIRLGLQKEMKIDPEKNPLLIFVRRIFPVTSDFEQDRFIIRRAGRLMVTPLLLVLLIVESTDLIFAVDSIPAVFAITQDPFLVYTSNAFAILGLRSLYFVLANVISKFTYLKLGLSIILTYVGVKMLLADVYPISTLLSLAIIALVLTATIVASVIRARHIAEKPGGSKEHPNTHQPET
ncbi:membrane protein [Ktedonobacteria bacterium brp13]|nr:membrane protein [Ktedonobacteria bacterium brp13]